jgi:long-subunit fatty acid transport protein
MAGLMLEPIQGTRFGVTYTSPVELDFKDRPSTGVQYSFSDRITAGIAYRYLNGGDAALDVERGPLAGRLEGDYKSYDVHFFALNLIWRL